MAVATTLASGGAGGDSCTGGGSDGDGGAELDAADGTREIRLRLLPLLLLLLVASAVVLLCLLLLLWLWLLSLSLLILPLLRLPLLLRLLRLRLRLLLLGLLVARSSGCTIVCVCVGCCCGRCCCFCLLRESFALIVRQNSSGRRDASTATAGLHTHTYTHRTEPIRCRVSLIPLATASAALRSPTVPDASGFGVGRACSVCLITRESGATRPIVTMHVHACSSRDAIEHGPEAHILLGVAQTGVTKLREAESGRRGGMEPDARQSDI